MRTKFGAKRFSCVFAMLLALLLCAALTGCNNQKNVDADVDDKPVVNLDEPEANEPDEQPGEPDDDTSAAADQRVTELVTTDPEVHVDLLKLDFDEGEIPESWYYRSTVDESGRASYEVQPVDADEPALLPMSSTVIYMTDAPEDGTDPGAYYERITLTYLLDGEPIESEQYQLFVPNIYDMSVNSMTGDAETIPAAGSLAR